MENFSRKEKIFKLYRLLESNQEGQAQEEIESVDDVEFAVQLQNIMKEFSGLAIPKREVIRIEDYDENASVTYSPLSESALGVVVFFGGLDGTFGNMPISLLDKIFASLNLDAIYITDSQRTMYLKGISGLSDNIEESARLLSNHIDSYSDSKPIYVLSTSAGGMANFIYGNLLRATTCLAFSPIYNCLLDGEDRARAVIRRLLKDMPAEQLNIGFYLNSQINFSNGIVIYGEWNSADSSQAKAFEDAVKEIQLIELAGVKKHNSFSGLLLQGNLVNVLKRYLKC